MSAMLKVRGIKREFAEVEIEFSDLVNLTIHELRRRAGLQPSQWVNIDNNVMDEFETPGSPAEFVVGPATPMQCDVYRLTTQLLVLHRKLNS